MAQEALEDRLNLHVSEDEREFSGFSEPDENSDGEGHGVHVEKLLDSSAKKRLKSVVVDAKENKNPVRGMGKTAVSTGKKKQTPKSSDKGKKCKSVEFSDSPGTSLSSDKFDLNKLTEHDIQGLRTLLGISPPIAQTSVLSTDDPFYGNYNEYENLEVDSADDVYTAVPVLQRPNLRVEVDATDINIEDDRTNVQNLSKEFSLAFDDQDIAFGPKVDSDDAVWDLPKLKVPEKGDPVNDSLASLINTAFTSQCDLDSVSSKYQVPVNCDRAIPPLVNQEIWKTLDKKAHLQDKSMVDIQNLVVTGLGPVVQLVDFMKKNNCMKDEAKVMFSDLLTVLGQVQFNLSLRRRYLIRPYLKKKYSSLCSISMPITTKLFGDDISKEVKSCDALSYIGKDYAYNAYRGVPRRRPFRRGYGNTSYGNSGYQQNAYYQRQGFRPYLMRGQSFKTGQSGRGRGVRRGASATSTTVSAPNGQE